MESPGLKVYKKLSGAFPFLKEIFLNGIVFVFLSALLIKFYIIYLFTKRILLKVFVL